jgi:signal transduction histidine kinase
LISIADNGIGFQDWEENEIFEKYSSGNIASTWLWMWLYLCKKIVEYHQWDIFAKNHPELWGALFEIHLPK